MEASRGGHVSPACARRILRGHHENGGPHCAGRFHLHHRAVAACVHAERLVDVGFHDEVPRLGVGQNPTQRHNEHRPEQGLHVEAGVFGDLRFKRVVPLLLQLQLESGSCGLGVFVAHGSLAHVEPVGVNVRPGRGRGDFHRTRTGREQDQGREGQRGGRLQDVHGNGLGHAKLMPSLRSAV